MKRKHKNQRSPSPQDPQNRSNCLSLSILICLVITSSLSASSPLNLLLNNNEIYSVSFNQLFDIEATTKEASTLSSTIPGYYINRYKQKAYNELKQTPVSKKQSPKTKEEEELVRGVDDDTRLSCNRLKWLDSTTASAFCSSSIRLLELNPATQSASYSSKEFKLQANGATQALRDYKVLNIANENYYAVVATEKQGVNSSKKLTIFAGTMDSQQSLTLSSTASFGKEFTGLPRIASAAVNNSKTIISFVYGESFQRDKKENHTNGYLVFADKQKGSKDLKLTSQTLDFTKFNFFSKYKNFTTSYNFTALSSIQISETQAPAPPAPSKSGLEQKPKTSNTTHLKLTIAWFAQDYGFYYVFCPFSIERTTKGAQLTYGKCQLIQNVGYTQSDSTRFQILESLGQTYTLVFPEAESTITICGNITAPPDNQPFNCKVVERTLPSYRFPTPSFLIMGEFAVTSPKRTKATDDLIL